MVKLVQAEFYYIKFPKSDGAMCLYTQTTPKRSVNTIKAPALLSHATIHVLGTNLSSAKALLNGLHNPHLIAKSSNWAKDRCSSDLTRTLTTQFLYAASHGVNVCNGIGQ